MMNLWQIGSSAPAFRMLMAGGGTVAIFIQIDEFFIKDR